MGEQALSGLKVLDMGINVAGPYCSKLLADYGADVIKIEQCTTGDPARRAGPFPLDTPHPNKSGLFNYLNNNKKGITLNISSNTGVMLLKDLVKQADVLVENYAPKVLPSLGLGYETLQKVNTGLVMTSISGFGQTGPYSDYQAFDLIEQAMGGWMYSGGRPDHEPLRPGVSLSEYVGGLSGAVATMTALYHRNQHGVGQHVDISIQEAMISANPYLLMAYSYLKQQIPRSGSPFPFTILPCKDGYIGVNILTQGQWELMCHFMGMSELVNDPRFIDGRSRLEHRDEITDIIRPWLLEKRREELFYEGQEWRIPYCLIPTVGEILNLAQHREREYFVEIDYAELGKVTQPGAPFRMTETPWEIRTKAPFLGEHNDEVYGECLGYTKGDLIRLRQRGII